MVNKKINTNYKQLKLIIIAAATRVNFDHDKLNVTGGLRIEDHQQTSL